MREIHNTFFSGSDKQTSCYSELIAHISFLGLVTKTKWGVAKSKCGADDMTALNFWRIMNDEDQN